MAMKTSIEADQATAKALFLGQEDTKRRTNAWLASGADRSITDLDVEVQPKCGAETQGSFCAQGYEGTDIGHTVEGVYFSLDPEGQSEYDRLRFSAGLDGETLHGALRGLAAQQGKEFVAEYGSLRITAPPPVRCLGHLHGPTTSYGNPQFAEKFDGANLAEVRYGGASMLASDPSTFAAFHRLLSTLQGSMLGAPPHGPARGSEIPPR